jgi:DNA repair protein RecN (Recombination protein N)
VRLGVLCELRVSQLGVIEDLSLVLGPGLTALTGETGAGKTLVVEAVQLLLGGRADTVLVRPGAPEAVVEGRFLLAPAHSQELVVCRVIPKQGRSRAYIDGRMATASALAEVVGELVDLHGQYEQQSLLSASAQRDALDAYAGAGAARARRDEASERVKLLDEAMAKAGGSSGAREREAELLRYQLAELESARLSTPDEDDRLAEEQQALARALEHRRAAELAHQALAGEEQVTDRLGALVAQLAGHPPLAGLHARLRGLLAELADAGDEARRLAESLEDDPERLAEVTERRALLGELRRKYASGDVGRPGLAYPTGSLEDVFKWREAAVARLRELEALAGEASRLAEEHARAMAELHAAARELGRARREAAGRLGCAVEEELRRLAMPKARFLVEVSGARGEAGTGAGACQVGGSGEWASASKGPLGEDLRQLAGEDVRFAFAANAGEPLAPLAKVASGGELARAMLALRLALLEHGVRAEPSGSGAQQGLLASPKVALPGPGTLIFDEVDAGTGGEAALAIGEALAELGQRYQVVVVTHLAQVAAFATSHIAVSKSERAGRTVATAATVSGEERLVELSRMLSGQPASRVARRHAEELLRSAGGVADAALAGAARRARRR